MKILVKPASEQSKPPEKAYQPHIALIFFITASLLVISFCGSAEGSAQKICFGAPARDTLQNECQRKSINLKVFPTPTAAKSLFGQYGADRNANLCRGGLAMRGGLVACNLGVPASKAKQSIALIGDSHSAHWRPGVDLAAKKAGWSVVSLAKGSCDYTMPERVFRSSGVKEAECKVWRERMPGWLKERPSIHTVIFAQNIYGSWQAPLEVESYKTAWSKLPVTIKRIIVIRDAPNASDNNAKCIDRAIQKRVDAGRACKYPRSVALRDDLAVRAARELDRPNVNVIDLTRFYCSSNSCFPVVGGALVYAQGSHLTPTFNETLGPYLLEAAQKLFL